MVIGKKVKRKRTKENGNKKLKEKDRQGKILGKENITKEERRETEREKM